jgi:hypothetical protein
MRPVDPSRVTVRPTRADLDGPAVPIRVEPLRLPAVEPEVEPVPAPEPAPAKQPA